MNRILSICLLACACAASAHAADSFTKRFAVEVQSSGIETAGEAGPGSGDTGTCGTFTGGDLQTNCEYGPGSFFDGGSEYGPGDREGQWTNDQDENPSDGFNCGDYDYYPDTSGCG